jgi:hypothetical protein
MAPHPPTAVQGSRNTGQGTASGGVARTLRRGIRSRSALQLRTSPVSPLSDLPSAEPPFQDFYRDYRSSPGTPSSYHPLSGYYAPQTNSQSGAGSTRSRLPYTAVRQSTIDRRPLPPLPSFRLGQDLPWTSPTATWMVLDDSEPTPTYDTTNSIVATPVQRTVEDPQRTRELAELNEAMMAVDLGDDGWHPGGMWERRPPRGPRELGWAVAVPTGDEARAGTTREIGDRAGRNGSRNDYDTDDEGHENPPPAYNAGQWGWDWEWVERGSYWIRSRPRRSTYYYA